MKKLFILMFSILSINLYSQEYIISVKKDTYTGRLKVDDSLVCESPFEKINNQCVLNCPEGTSANQSGNACLYPAINGICGSDNGATIATGNVPTNVCNSGELLNLSNNLNQFNWTCEGIKNDLTRFNGSDSNCFAYKEAECDTNYGTCTVGTSDYTSSIGSSIVTWNCNNINSNKSCSKAALAAINGVCGSSHNQLTNIQPTENLCTTGTASSVTTNNGEYLWNCQGSLGSQTQISGTSSSCKTQTKPVLTASHWYSGNGGNYNTPATLVNATDGNISTRTAYWYALYSGSATYIRFTPDKQITNKKLTVYWNDIVYNGYGNRMYIEVAVLDQGAWRYIYYGNIVSSASGVDRQASYDFSRFDAVQFYIYDNGGGAPHIAIRDIIIE